MPKKKDGIGAYFRRVQWFVPGRTIISIPGVKDSVVLVDDCVFTTEDSRILDFLLSDPEVEPVDEDEMREMAHV